MAEATEALVLARAGLAAPRDEASARLLLEGESTHGAPSLDRDVDAAWGWLDRSAVDWADRLGRSPEGRFALTGTSAASAEEVNAAWVNALRLRYGCLKILRAAAWLDLPKNTHDWPRRVRLVVPVDGPVDGEYPAVFAEFCRRTGRELSLDVQTPDRSSSNLPNTPANPWWRRAAEQAAGWLDRKAVGPGPRLLFCGNPSLLEPVCDMALDHGAQAAWLFDRFAVHAWRRLRRRGVRQFTCNSSLGRVNPWPMSLPADNPFEPPPGLEGWDLSQAVAGFLNRRLEAVGAAQGKMVEQIGEHLDRWRPQVLVLDEDATPLARIAIHLARRRGVPSLVVQHGAPFVRFGFAPGAGDRICVWGESARRRLMDWGAAPDSIAVTGCPKHDAWPAFSWRPHGRRRPHLLLLATTPPTDDRPDAVEFHFTSGAHARLLDAAVQCSLDVGAGRTTIKLHPRTTNLAPFQNLSLRFPQANIQLERHGDFRSLVLDADVVLSCASSSGLEAALLGAPVVQLLPEGSGGFPPAEEWGLLGSAASADALTPLVRRALDEPETRPPLDGVFACLGGSAAAVQREIHRLAGLLR